MKQARFASRLEPIPLSPEIVGRRGALKVNRSRDRHVQKSIVLDQKRHTGMQQDELIEEAQEVDTISAAATCTPALTHQEDAAPMKTPATEYRRATDEQLLAAARSADKEAFAELSGRCVDVVHRKVLAIVRNHEDAEDIVQEALFKAYTHLDGFRGTSAFSTWLIRIAINSALMMLRKRRLHSEVSLDQSGDDDQTRAVWELADPSPNAEQICSMRQTNDLLLHALSRLPPRSRTILEQYHAHEQSVKEAANTLGITMQAAKSRLMRARVTTRTILERKRVSMANVSY